MKERPILFNASMVRAILDGRKTQTRRVIKKRKTINPRSSLSHGGVYSISDLGAELRIDTKPNMPCPYGIPGDRLWVRETWTDDAFGDGKMYVGKHFYYEEVGDAPKKHFKWKPSIFMPRWASRIDLEITDIRVERVQEIQGYDIAEEGIYSGGHLSDNYAEDYETFKELWNSLNAKRGYGWDMNPWVWVISFRRIRP